MPVERGTASTNVADVLDRVLDKGVVIDAWVRVSLVGIDLITVEARVVVASIATYLQFADAVTQIGTASRTLDTTRTDGFRRRTVTEAGKPRRQALCAVCHRAIGPEARMIRAGNGMLHESCEHLLRRGVLKPSNPA